MKKTVIDLSFFDSFLLSRWQRQYILIQCTPLKENAHPYKLSTFC